MYKKRTLHFYTYTKNVQIVQNLYKVSTKNGLQLEMHIFCAYKQCTNYTKLCYYNEEPEVTRSNKK